jgi:hypothetical protein
VGVALGDAVDLRLQDPAHEVGVGAVDDELQALAGVRVVDRLHLGLERQQALAAGLLGQADHQLDVPGVVDDRALEGDDHQLRDHHEVLEVGARHDRARGAAPDHHERRDVEQRHRVRALEHGREETGADGDGDPDGGDGFHGRGGFRWGGRGGGQATGFACPLAIGSGGADL